MRHKKRPMWWKAVKLQLGYYPIAEKTTQAAIFNQSVEKAMEETRLLPDGELRIKLVTMVYIKRSHYTNGAASECNVSRTTACRWLNSFVKMTARNAGYL